jgi:hypothetical protein
MADEMTAVTALRARGVDDAESLLEYADADAIVRTCDWYDKQGARAHKGLLVWKIRQGGVGDKPPTKGEQLRAQFAQAADRYPEGATTETHEQMRQRRWPNDRDRCPGQFRVTAAMYPTLMVQCDTCGFEAAYPVAQLHVLGERNDDATAAAPF